MKGPFLPRNPWRACAWRIAIQIQRTAPAKEVKHLTFISSNLQNMKLLNSWLQIKEMEGTELNQHTQALQKINLAMVPCRKEYFKYSTVAGIKAYHLKEDWAKTAFLCIPNFSVPQFLACQNLCTAVSCFTLLIYRSKVYSFYRKHSNGGKVNTWMTTLCIFQWCANLIKKSTSLGWHMHLIFLEGS